MLNLNMLHLNMYTRKTNEKRNFVKSLRHVLTGVLALAAAAATIGCGKSGKIDSSTEQRPQLALEQLLSCTLQQAEDFDAKFALSSEEAMANGEIGLTQDDGRLREYFLERFGDSMTDACIETLAASRTFYKSAALAKDLNSDIHVDEVELTKSSDEPECYQFSAVIKTSAGDPAAAANGMISMEKDGDERKASRITLTMEETHN